MMMLGEKITRSACFGIRYDLSALRSGHARGQCEDAGEDAGGAPRLRRSDRVPSEG